MNVKIFDQPITKEKLVCHLLEMMMTMLVLGKVYLYTILSASSHDILFGEFLAGAPELLQSEVLLVTPLVVLISYSIASISLYNFQKFF